MAELAERGQARRSGQWAPLAEQWQGQGWDLWVSAPMLCLRQVEALGLDRVEAEAGHTALLRPIRLRRTTRPGVNEEERESVTMKAKSKVKNETPRFYEMDGALRAYSNRSIVIAGVMGLVSLVAVVGFLFVRMQPPTVIRVNSEGEASVITPYRAKPRLLPSVLAANTPNAAPDEYEKQAFIKSFLVRYLDYDPHTLSQNWADAMNQMTTNLRRSALTVMEKNDTVGKLEEEQGSSTFKLSHIEESKDDPLTYTAFGVRTVRSMNNEHELINQLVEEYHLRLINIERSADNPSGLLIGEYWSKQIQGEKRDAVLADSTLAGTAGRSSTSQSGVTDGGITQ